VVCLNSGNVQCISFSMASDILQFFAKYNKTFQNVNSKRLQLTTIYFLTLNGHLALFCAKFLILTPDIDIHAMDTPINGDSCFTIMEPVKYWIIISLFRFFFGLFLIGII
jgi:hypothetical protein